MATRSPASKAARNARMNPADEPVVTTMRAGSMSRHPVRRKTWRCAGATTQCPALRYSRAAPPRAPPHRGNRGCRRADGRLADLHMDDAAALRLEPRRSRLTSITMNGGTALRADGCKRRCALSSINSPLRSGFWPARRRPAAAVFSGFRGAWLRRGDRVRPCIGRTGVHSSGPNRGTKTVPNESCKIS